MSESKIQASFHKYIWNTYHKTRYLCYHIPNEARRTGYAYMIAMGMVPGIPDYHINIPSGEYRSLYQEFKSEDGKLSEKQIKVHNELRKNGHKVDVVRSFDEALKSFLDYAEGTEYLRK
jgi:hypothetical protein